MFGIAPSAILTIQATSANAKEAARQVTNASSGELPDLPPVAVWSYLQYRFLLQLVADFYVFDLQTMVADTGEKLAHDCLVTVRRCWRYDNFRLILEKLSCTMVSSMR